MEIEHLTMLINVTMSNYKKKQKIQTEPAQSAKREVEEEKCCAPYLD